MTVRDTSLVAFTRELHRLGFRRDGRTRDPLLYVKRVHFRELDLQLWRDGRHRVSHFLVNPRHPYRKRSTTHPTSFTDVPGMKRAIRRELARTDHKLRWHAKRRSVRG